ncbi:MAG: hypothetical protein LKJ47_04825 [Bifidobacteriaceae bacterium]|jgi:hypothetical protein|nr:hypothetical protein [Bifidobacteriaceae bacterium]
MTFPIQTLIVQKANSKKHKVGPLDAPVQLVNPDGSAFSGGAASAGAKGDKGDTGAAGASITALALTTDADGKITGGTATLSDKTTVPVTVTTAAA